MRLLKRNEDGDFSLETYHDDDLPTYAILSHTWEQDEVSFEDLMSGTGWNKTGYLKLHFCADRAQSDHLDYFWVDTCCIDKSNSAELAEAINSMFGWYEKAHRCYVWLRDVRSGLVAVNDHPHRPLWELEFRQSRWFTRGWTLQELIAPVEVIFYAADTAKIGDRIGLKSLISEITGVPKELLNSSKRLDEYSVSERMTWASHRMTTRIEDRAYCLMRLFGVYMPVLYGEGENAFQRLQKEIMGLTNQTSGLRLIVVDSRPLAIETFPGQKVPDYAILSHTWGINEVSFQDVLLGRGTHKKGYQKILSCCELAAFHGFKYLWVDTCCIDKTSSAELQEAICSMFKWYKNAQKCYVYLEDYEPYEPWGSLETPLSSCKWFKRGWTLQELIAPSSVEFYNSRWRAFGTKANLCQQIADITGIDPAVLRGADPTSRTVAERMSWASMRSTSRIEDTAYSLMGLFNVFMPMLYGEGERAFIRLQEEVMKQSEDYTIFAWRNTGLASRQLGLFAQSPSQFQSCVQTLDNMRLISQYRTLDQQLHNPAVLTSRGLLIGLPLLKDDEIEAHGPENHKAALTYENNYTFFHSFRDSGRSSDLRPGIYLALICRMNTQTSKEMQILCIWLRKDPQSGLFTRYLPGRVVIISEKRAVDFKVHSIYVLPSFMADENVIRRSRQIVISLPGFIMLSPENSSSAGSDQSSVCFPA